MKFGKIFWIFVGNEKKFIKIWITAIKKLETRSVWYQYPILHIGDVSCDFARTLKLGVDVKDISSAIVIKQFSLLFHLNFSNWAQFFQLSKLPSFSWWKSSTNPLKCVPESEVKRTYHNEKGRIFYPLNIVK